MPRFAGPGIIALGLVAGKATLDFSVLVSIGANGSLECAAGFGEGVLVVCGEGCDGGRCESVFGSGTLAGLTSGAGDEFEVCH